MSGRDISVTDNVLERILGATQDTIGIHVARADNRLGDAIQVRNNHIRDFHWAIQATGSNTPGSERDLTRLVVVGNQIRGTIPGTRAKEAIRIGPRVPAATVHGNQVAPGETETIRLLTLVSSEEGDPSPVPPLYIVTAAGFAGNGKPQGVVAAEVGSFYTPLEGTESFPSLWIKEQGDGVDGWVQWVPRGT
jgi:hypothetical protein